MEADTLQFTIADQAYSVDLLDAQLHYEELSNAATRRKLAEVPTDAPPELRFLASEDAAISVVRDFKTFLSQIVLAEYKGEGDAPTVPTSVAWHFLKEMHVAFDAYKKKSSGVLTLTYGTDTPSRNSIPSNNASTKNPSPSSTPVKNSESDEQARLFPTANTPTT